MTRPGEKLFLRIRTGAMFLAALMGLACCTDGALAQEEVVSANGQQAPHRSEVYLGIYVLGTLPKDRNLVVGGDEIPRTNVGNGIGAGFKAGIYPAFTTRIIGIEGETFGHSADISAPRTTVNGGTRFANANLILVNTMANLVARYPGDLLQPFVGVGGGLSNAFLTGTDIQRGTDRLTGTTSSTSLAYQFLAGLRANVTNRLFVFGEFKYFVAKYTWDADNSGPSTSLEFRTKLVTGGVGLSF